MACYHPLLAHRDKAGGEVYFGAPHSVVSQSLQLPCGKCGGCLARRAQSWAVRIMHEASLHEANCFVTLTYDAEHLPVAGTLDREAFPLFIKRLRKRIFPRKVRYFHAGEYGGRFGRPHYHACLFGFAFPDSVVVGSRGGFPVARSELLQEVWPLGFSEIGSLTMASAAYVARYVLKKSAVSAPLVDADTGVVLEKEYATMSRRPGIGAGWIDRWKDEVYPRDLMVLEGREIQPPRYYDGKLSPVELEKVKAERFARVEALKLTKARLEAMEVYSAAKADLYEERKVF